MLYLNVNQSKYSHPLVDADNCIKSLSKNEVASLLLHHLDVLTIDELGLTSAQMCSIIDLALKHVNKTDSSMGSLLVVANGDPYQLTPIQGTTIFLRTHMLLGYEVNLLKQHVRSGVHPALQKIRNLLRKLNTNEKEVKMFQT